MPKGGQAKNLGGWGETQACNFLTRSGFSIVERNYFTTAGEIDIIARAPGGEYYFIEVKTRQQGDFATDTAITPFKKMKIQKTLRRYCYDRRISDQHGLITAGLLVTINRFAGSIKFRLAVYC